MKTTTTLSRSALQSMAENAGCASNIFSSNMTPSNIFNWLVGGIASSVLSKVPGGNIGLGVIIALAENQKVQCENVIRKMKDSGYKFLIVTTTYTLTGYDPSGIPNYKPTGMSFTYSNSR